MLDSILQRVTKLSQVAVWLGGALLIFAALMTTVDVVLRKVLNWSFGGADEIAGYMFAISTAFAMSYALLQRSHVRIDALYTVLPPRVRTVLDVLAFLMLASFLVLITERAFAVWWGSYESSSVSITPRGLDEEVEEERAAALAKLEDAKALLARRNKEA